MKASHFHAVSIHNRQVMNISFMCIIRIILDSLPIWLGINKFSLVYRHNPSQEITINGNTDDDRQHTFNMHATILDIDRGKIC